MSLRSSSSTTWILGVCVIAVLGVGGWCAWDPKPLSWLTGQSVSRELAENSSETDPADNPQAVLPMAPPEGQWEPEIVEEEPESELAFSPNDRNPQGFEMEESQEGVQNAEFETAPQDHHTNDILLTGNEEVTVETVQEEAPKASVPRVADRPASVKKSPGSTSRTEVRDLNLDRALKLIDEGQPIEAYKLLSEWYFRYPDQRPHFQKQLDDLARSLYFSPQWALEEPYVIQSGDQLRKIANKYHLSWQYLARLNKVDPTKIRPGRKLKVLTGPFDAIVDASSFELVIVLNGQYVKSFRVGLGKDNATPLGEFNVLEKLENPKYYGTNDGVREADDHLNPLGERWIDIGNSFGIHGTIDPGSIGQKESRGCVRMLNEDVAEVYDLLTVGSKVTIQE